jgi:signal transduction histidine kinase
MSYQTADAGVGNPLKFKPAQSGSPSRLGAAIIRRLDSARARKSDDPTSVIAFIRLTLAGVLLAVTYYVTQFHSSDASYLKVALAFYGLYSVLYCLSFWSRFHWLLRDQTHWIEVGWFGLFLALGEGPSLILLPGFLFATIIASFSPNKLTALRVAIVSLALIVADLIYNTGFIADPTRAAGEISAYLLPSISLLLIGFLMSYHGSMESLLRRRLGLMKDVMALSNPRFGVDRTIGSVMEQVRSFYGAEACVLVMSKPGSTNYELRRADRINPDKAMSPEEISPELAGQFLDGLGDHSVLYLRGWVGQRKIYGAPEADGGSSEKDNAQRYDGLSTILDAKSFITVPVVCHNEAIGRLYVTVRRPRSFTKSDTDFLSQVIMHILPVIENIRLVDRLASDAAEQERHRIARDIHDSVIQPYIGIQLGLGVIRQKLEGGKFDVNNDLERLIEMTQLEIHGLRQYVGGLSQAQSRQASLVQALKRFAEKFTGATGIAVEIEAETEIKINDRLTAEVVQLVAEGLSNIRRHTQSSRCSIKMGCRRGHFQLRIGNETEKGARTESFIPKSITARTHSLGGRVSVENSNDGWTLLEIEIPL